MTSRLRLHSDENGGTAETQAIMKDKNDTNEQTEDQKSNKEQKYRLLWLDRCILYFPMCTSLKPSIFTKINQIDKNKLVKRNKYWIAFIITISLLLCILLAISSIENFVDDDMVYYYLNDLLFEICQILFKLFSLHYFYSFNFPWHSNYKFSYISSKDVVDVPRKLWPQKMAKIIIVLMSIIYIPYIVLHSYFGHTETSALQENAFVSIVSDIAFAYFWWFPITFTFAVHTALCVKYRYCLSQIISYIQLIKDKNKNINITLKEVLLDYESLYEVFKNEYGSSLRCSTLSFLLGTILYFWGLFFNVQIKDEFGVSMEYIIVSGIIGVIGSFLMVIMYTLPASFLNSECKKLEKELWHTHFIHTDEWKFSMHFLAFTKKYYVGIRLGKFVVTYKNVICFFIAFGITKYITFSIRSQT